MSKYYDEALIPAELRRNFDVYDRIRALQLPLGSFETDVVSLANAGIAGGHPRKRSGLPVRHHGRHLAHGRRRGAHQTRPGRCAEDRGYIDQTTALGSELRWGRRLKRRALHRKGPGHGSVARRRGLSRRSSRGEWLLVPLALGLRWPQERLRAERPERWWLRRAYTPGVPWVASTDASRLRPKSLWRYRQPWRVTSYAIAAGSFHCHPLCWTKSKPCAGRGCHKGMARHRA